MRLDEVGTSGQQRLHQSSVLVIGAGGLGSPSLHHLAASGVGRIGIAEFDTVDISNIHRQTLFSTDDIGRSKVEAARDRLLALNPDVRLDLYPEGVTARNADDLLNSYDLVLDGSDTFATRYIVNDASVRTGTPNVFASVSQFSGQTSVLGAENGPCYRCLYPEPPPAGLIPSCEEGGVLGVLPSLLGTVQATEALKIIIGMGTPLIGRLLMVDALDMRVREIRIDKDPSCPVCGAQASSSAPKVVREVSPTDLQHALSGADPPLLLDVRTQRERNARSIGGLHIPVEVLDEKISEVDSAAGGGPVVVYCQSGVRSSSAALALLNAGIQASSLRGGLNSYPEIDL